MAWKDEDDTTVGQRVGSHDLRAIRIAGQTAYQGAMGDDMLGRTGAMQAVTEVDGQKMTIVPTSFDQANPDHQRTFLHEMGHDLFKMGEEAAQATERCMMIMQQMDPDFTIQKGLDMMGRVQGRAADQVQGELMTRIASGDERTREDEANAMQGYSGMCAQGLHHQDIVKRLAEWGLEAMEKYEKQRQDRSGESTSEDT